MLKKLGGAIVVAAVAFAGMAASAAVAVEMMREAPEAGKPAAAPAAVAQPAKNKEKTKKAKRAAAKPALAHAWDTACAEAKVDVELAVATAQISSPDEFLRLAREGVAINVRLYQTLRATGGGGPGGRTFLAALAKSIADDNRDLATLRRSMSQQQLARILARSQRTNAKLARLALGMNAPACANYFSL